ncbi:MAG TPA: hypothetical protein VNV61_14600 [Steroidobacteraceae bacterium]|jgi:hypothetical protein|nr:hypothetical protein [Steroidobacteraceae bacterium]
MSSVTNLSLPSSAALPPANLSSHGHKHGSKVNSTDSSSTSDASAQSPTAATQSLFGTLLQSLEQVVGLQTSTTPATTASTTTAAATTASTAAATTASATGTSSTQQQQSMLLQNYLNNLSHKGQAGGTQSPTVAGSSISTNA